MLKFGNRVEMMVDRYLIDRSDGVRFCHCRPQNLGKVIGFDKEWEGAGSLCISALDADGRVMLYYRGFPTGGKDTDPLQCSCLAVSDNGVDFGRFPVNEFDYKGIKENNIVYNGPDCHNFAPFYDTNPDCPPELRYKAIGGTFQTGGIRIYCSPDGVHWRAMADEPVITSSDFAFDSMNMAFWDQEAGLYRVYYRYWEGDIRAIGSAASKDFVNWTEMTPNDYGEPPRDDLYTNAARPVPGAEHILLAMPMRFQEDRTKYPEYKKNGRGINQGVSDAVLMTSRDGVHWDRAVKDAWIAGGLYDHEWTQRCFISAGGVIARGDRFIFYVEQNYMWEDGGIWAYSVPKFRFTSLYADGSGGSFATKPLEFVSDDIYLNFSTSAYGYVKVKVFSQDGTGLFDSGEVFGNELSHRLHIDGLAGKTGYLTVDLNEAHLYAIGSDMNE